MFMVTLLMPYSLQYTRGTCSRRQIKDCETGLRKWKAVSDNRRCRLPIGRTVVLEPALGPNFFRGMALFSRTLFWEPDSSWGPLR
jgi:hypothetical protein